MNGTNAYNVLAKAQLCAALVALQPRQSTPTYRDGSINFLTDPSQALQLHSPIMP